MADSGIKQFRVPISEMPPVNSLTEGYSIRYRIVSDDKNRFSHWSPVYIVKPEYTFVAGQVEYNKNNSVVSVDWDSVTILKNVKTVNNVVNKSLDLDLATITTLDAHYMSVGDWVTVSDVDSVFNGTYQITNVTSNTFSYYRDHANIASTVVTPPGEYTTNSLIRRATEYDIWVRWDRNDGGDWIYKERINSTNISFPIPPIYTKNGEKQPSAPNHFSIELYLKGYPVQRADGVPLEAGSPFLKVYEILNETV
jgi:hypothetical protein